MTSAREAELLAELKARDERLDRLEKENALLRRKIDLLVRQLFGARSERLDPAQLLLLLQGGDAPPKAPEPVAAEEPRRSTVPSPPRERRPRLPEHLPVIEEVLDPAPVKACPSAWRCIGQEVSEQLDYEPARFLRRRLIRRKYVRRGEVDAVPVILTDYRQNYTVALPAGVYPLNGYDLAATGLQSSGSPFASWVQRDTEEKQKYAHRILGFGRFQFRAMPNEVRPATTEEVAAHSAQYARLVAAHEEEMARRAKAAGEAAEYERLKNEWRWRMDNLQRSVDQLRR